MERTQKELSSDLKRFQTADRGSNAEHAANMAALIDEVLDHSLFDFAVANDAAWDVSIRDRDVAAGAVKILLDDYAKSVNSSSDFKAVEKALHQAINVEMHAAAGHKWYLLTKASREAG